MVDCETVTYLLNVVGEKHSLGTRFVLTYVGNGYEHMSGVLYEFRQVNSGEMTRSFLRVLARGF